MKKKYLEKLKKCYLNLVKSKVFLIILLCFFSFISILISYNQKNNKIKQLIIKAETITISSIRASEIRYHALSDAITRLSYLDFPTDNNSYDGNANFLLNSFPEINYIAWVDNNYVIENIVPLSDNESKLNKKANTIKIDSNSINKWGTVFENSSFQGFIIYSINIPKLFEPFQNTYLDGFMYEIIKNGEIIYQSKNWQNINKELSITRILSLQKSDEISLTCIPSKQLTQSIQYFFYKTLIIALLFSILIVLTVFFAQKFYFVSKLNEDRYKKLLDNASLYAFILNTKGKIIYCNDFFLASTGWKRKDIIGTSFIERFSNSKNKSYNILFQGIFTKNDLPNYLEFPIITKNNNTRWIHFNRTIQTNIKGEITGFLALGEDITEQKNNAEALLKQYQFLKTLFSIDQAITSREDIHKTFNYILDEVNLKLGADASSILLFNKNNNCLEYAEGKGYNSLKIQNTCIPIGLGPTGLAILDQKSISVNNIKDPQSGFIRRDIAISEGYNWYHVEPLIVKNKVNGVIELFFKETFVPDKNWNSFIKAIAQQTAIVIDNSTLFKTLKNTNKKLLNAYESTIEGWSKALELRDRETENHSHRVTDLTIQVCSLYGMSESELINIRRGALLHDIGKMGIPDSILLKKEKLTDNDWQVIKKHPQYAYDLIYPIEYLRPALDIPYCHHEKWDGTGYPRGLKGTQIPIAARVFAIVDVWDALLSNRPYRDAWPKEKVIKEIKRLSGTHFDPKAVELFLRVVENFE